MILLTQYNNEWPHIFASEKKRILKHAKQWIKSIDHVGSTAIPSMIAKPTIDILIGVQSVQLVEHHLIAIMQDLGYRYIKKYEATVPERRYFKLSTSILNATPPVIAFPLEVNPEELYIQYNVHIVNQDKPFYKNILLFKNILLTSPEVFDQYRTLKLDLMLKHDSEFDYAQAKSELIAKALRVDGKT